MPTTLPRTQITHTSPVEEALALAAKQWPGERPGALLNHIITDWAQSKVATRVALKEEHQETALRVSRELSALLVPETRDCLEIVAEMRAEWPD